MKRLTATLCLTIAVLLGSVGVGFSLPICNKISDKSTTGEFSQRCIQSVLENYIINKSTGFFTFSVSSRENVYVQGYTSEQNVINLELVSKNYLTNPNILDKDKFIKLLRMGWVVPVKKDSNYTFSTNLGDVFNNNVSKFLYDSFKVFALTQDKIDVSYRIGDW
tara:strand:- start:7 stop:498 length:492 start_codon:yes stop_codon:yes gene_type:complete